MDREQKKGKGEEIEGRKKQSEERRGKGIKKERQGKTSIFSKSTKF